MRCDSGSRVGDCVECGPGVLWVGWRSGVSSTEQALKEEAPLGTGWGKPFGDCRIYLSD